MAIESQYLNLMSLDLGLVGVDRDGLRMESFVVIQHQNLSIPNMETTKNSSRIKILKNFSILERPESLKSLESKERE